MVVEDISPSPPVPSTASDPGATMLQMSEMTTDNSSYIPPALEVTSEVDEVLRTALHHWGDEDVEALRVENKDLREQLVFFEDARARATYDVIKAWTIQRACVNAQKTVESQLKSCQNVIYAKDKELTDALNELSKAQGLLAKLGVPGYAEPHGPTGTFRESWWSSLGREGNGSRQWYLRRREKKIHHCTN
ncbi:Uncharacterized protein Fot_19870 [Forsythia ovata]|uniref:Uncharacterized protein n=1 Tax=Forsythia ovata TaxID=205694 RepID=A0ABD1VM98_9LAMI